MIKTIGWNAINRRISRTFVMFAISCMALSMLGVAELLGTMIVFLVLAGITYWFAKLTK